MTGLDGAQVVDLGTHPIELTQRMAHVMEQVSALAPLNDTDRVWLEDVPVGEATVKLGLSPSGQTRMLIVRA